MLDRTPESVCRGCYCPGCGAVGRPHSELERASGGCQDRRKSNGRADGSKSPNMARLTRIDDHWGDSGDSHVFSKHRRRSEAGPRRKCPLGSARSESASRCHRDVWVCYISRRYNETMRKFQSRTEGGHPRVGRGPNRRSTRSGPGRGVFVGGLVCDGIQLSYWPLQRDVSVCDDACLGSP